MHHACVICQAELLIRQHPVRVITIDPSIVVISAPILYVNKICALQRLALIMLDGRSTCEFFVQLVVFRMCDHKFGFTPGIDPFCKAVGHTLWKRFDVWGPRENDLWFSFLLERLVDCDDIGETL